MSPKSRLVAGILLILVPAVEIGGASILSLHITDPSYTQNDLRQDLWRAGHAHAGVWLVLSLVALRHEDEATLSEGMRWLVRLAFPAAAILMPLAFFLSVLSPEATEPNAMIYLAYLAGIVLAVRLLVLGIGLIRRPLTPREGVKQDDPNHLTDLRMELWAGKLPTVVKGAVARSEQRGEDAMRSVREGRLESGLPCLSFGEGSPLVVFPGIGMTNANPSGLQRWG